MKRNVIDWYDDFSAKDKKAGAHHRTPAIVGDPDATRTHTWWGITEQRKRLSPPIDTRWRAAGWNTTKTTCAANCLSTTLYPVGAGKVPRAMWMSSWKL